MSKNNRLAMVDKKILYFLLLLVVIIGVLAWALLNRAPIPVAVAPVTGLPQGTDGYPWWNDTVFYEVFVRSFKDTNGDGSGDFQGLTEQLDYLNDGKPETSTDLGITGLWLMPVHPSPSYHGYDVSDFYAINAQYGTMDDFRHFLDQAHQRGIRVIIDLVMNHTSIGNAWFSQARQDPSSSFRNWYIWSDTDPGYPGPWGQQVWYKTDNGYYYAIFWEGMPDLNYNEPAVIKEMENVAKFWLQDVGVDGFRLDAAKHIVEAGQTQENSAANHTWWETFRKAYKSYNPQAMTVGEVWSSTDQVSKYLEGDELDLAFDFDLAGTMVSGAGTLSANTVRNGLAKTTKSFKPGQYAVFLTNHDQDRTMNKMLNDPQRAKLAASVLLTTPGVPFIYYGEEIGMLGVKPDENIRTPMQWNADKNAGFSTASYTWRPVNSDYKEKNVAAQLNDPGSLLVHYRLLISLRNQHAALRIGDYIEIIPSDRKALAYLRVSQGETILVIVNFTKDALSDVTFSLKDGALTGSYRAVPLLFTGGPEKSKPFAELIATSTGGMDAYQPLPEGQSLPPYCTLVIQLQAASK